MNRFTQYITPIIKSFYAKSRPIVERILKKAYSLLRAFIVWLYPILIKLLKRLYQEAKRWLRRVFEVLVIRREKRAITYAIIALFVSLLTIFKCANSSQNWRKELSINFLIENQMSDFEQTARLDKEIESFMKSWELTGATFALMRNDSLIYAKGYGYANKKREERCEVKHVFRIASASKLITATAIMKLIECDKLELSSQVFGEEGILCDSMFLKLRNRDLKKITVEHLLRHTGGFSSPINDPAFANYSVARYLEKDLPLTLDDMVLYATMNKLKYQPGGVYEYSNLGYMVLTKIIEVVSGQSYESYVKDAILTPANCYDMYIGQNFSRDRDKNEVQYYEVKEAEPVEAYDGSGKMTMKSDGGNNVTLLSGAGGWVASSVELLRFVASINGGGVKEDVISKESVNKMTYDSNNRLLKPMGWATVRGSEWIRSGSMAGTNTLIKRQANGYTWVFITNSSAWIGYHLTDKLSRHITNAISKVKKWPTRDLFEIGKGDELAEEF